MTELSFIGGTILLMSEKALHKDKPLNTHIYIFVFLLLFIFVFFQHIDLQSSSVNLLLTLLCTVTVFSPTVHINTL